MLISYAKRIDFDNFLVNKLSSDFASKILGNGVKSFHQQENGILVKLKDGKQILTELVVGADGANSVVNRKLIKSKIDKNRSSTFVSAYFYNVENMPIKNDAEVRMIYNKMPLFFYIFPLADGSVNVSLGGRADHVLKHNINLIEEVEQIIESHKKVKGKFIKAKRSSNWRGWSIPFHFGKNKVIGNRFLLVGDAGGFANAFYKEGVGTGMMSGIIAANTIKKCINLNDFGEETLKEYQENVRKEFRKLLKFSYYTLRVARFKKLFSRIVSISKRRIERKQYKMIQKRSY
jgi:flavin-dependent dehydrogenase